MKQKMKLVSRSAAVFLLIIALLAPWIVTAPSDAPVPATAEGLPYFTLPSGVSSNFGGMILKKQFKLCLIKVPPPIFILPIPFYYIEVGPPGPALLYYLFGITNEYLEYEVEKTSNSLGNYWVGASEAFRQICINKPALPIAMGIINKIGTSCRTDPKYLTDECHKRVLKRELAELLHYKLMLAQALLQVKILTAFYQNSFSVSGALSSLVPGPHGTGSGPSSPGYPGDSADPADDYSAYCDAYSPAGSCYPVGACDPDASASAGCCIFTQATQDQCIAETGAVCDTGCTPAAGGGTSTIPSGLAAPIVGSSSVTLTWNGVSGASDYNVYRNGSYIASSPYPNYTDPTVIAGSSYVYSVSSIVSGIESGHSATVSVNTSSDSTPPTAPSGLTYTIVGGTTVYLSWMASTDNVGVTQYHVYRDGSQQASTGTMTSYSDTYASSGTHTYYIIALDAANNISPASNTVNATLP